jgi:hypothetical protein
MPINYWSVGFVYGIVSMYILTIIKINDVTNFSPMGLFLNSLVNGVIVGCIYDFIGSFINSLVPYEWQEHLLYLLTSTIIFSTLIYLYNVFYIIE